MRRFWTIAAACLFSIPALAAHLAPFTDDHDRQICVTDEELHVRYALASAAMSDYHPVLTPDRDVMDDHARDIIAAINTVVDRKFVIHHGNHFRLSLLDTDSHNGITITVIYGDKPGHFCKVLTLNGAESKAVNDLLNAQEI